MSYGITVWGSASEYLIKRIEKLQDRTVKHLGMQNSQTRKEMYTSLNILTVQNLYYYKTVINNYKDFQDCQKIDHNYRTRSHESRNLKNETFTNKYGRRTKLVKLPKMYNELPQHLREQQRIGQVKKDLKNWLIREKVNT